MLVLYKNDYTTGGGGLHLQVSYRTRLRLVLHVYETSRPTPSRNNFYQVLARCINQYLKIITSREQPQVQHILSIIQTSVAEPAQDVLKMQQIIKVLF